MYVVIVLTFKGISILQREQWVTKELAERRAQELKPHWSRVYIARLEEVK